MLQWTDFNLPAAGKEKQMLETTQHLKFYEKSTLFWCLTQVLNVICLQNV